MKKLLVLLLLVVCCAAPAQGTLLLYDGFDYTAGEKLAPRNDTTVTPNPGQFNVANSVNWRYAGAGGAANEAPGIASGSLSYPGLLGSTGNSVAHDMTMLGSSRIQMAPSPINSGTVYWSGLLRVDAISNLNTVNGLLVGGFTTNAGAGTLPGVVGAVLRIRKDVSLNQYYVGTAMNSGTATGTSTNVQYADGVGVGPGGGTNPSLPQFEGETVFVVAAYEFIAGATNDRVSMWINPDALTFGANTPPTPTITSQPFGSVADSFASTIAFNIRNVNTVGNPTVRFDELRVGTDWASVTPSAVPETSSFLLVGCALLMARKKAVITLVSRVAALARQ